MLYNIFSQIMINRKQNKEMFLKKKKSKQNKEVNKRATITLYCVLFSQPNRSTRHKSPQKVVSLVLFVLLLPHRLLLHLGLKRLPHLVWQLKYMFSIFKQYYIYFPTLFYPHVFLHIFSNNKIHVSKCMYQTFPEHVQPRCEMYFKSGTIKESRFVE